MQVGMGFGWLLGRFLVDFGPKLGAKLVPSWHQNRKNEGPKTMSKKHQKSGDARVREETQPGDLLAPNNTIILQYRQYWQLAAGCQYKAL